MLYVQSCKIGTVQNVTGFEVATSKTCVLLTLNGYAGAPRPGNQQYELGHWINIARLWPVCKACK